MYNDLPLPTSPSLSPNILVRPAKPSDARELADSFYRSFGDSNKFWSINFAGPKWHRFWEDAWRMGVEDDETARTFVAVDKDGDVNKVVGFARWIVPQADGNLERVWPGMPEGEESLGVVNPFFEGMGANRKEFMGQQPHWFLEMLGTDTAYQRHGIGYTFCKWGCDLADKDDLPVYIDASERGAPFYRKHLGAEKMKIIEIPDRSEKEGGHGHYEYWTHVVPRRSERGAKEKEKHKEVGRLGQAEK